MKVFKSSIMSKDDHVLYNDKIVNVSNGKEFTTVSDALDDVTTGTVLLLWYLGIQFDLGDNGCIELQDIRCNNRDIYSIYSSLCYLSDLKCSVETYYNILDFVDEVCTKDDKCLSILTCLTELRSK